MKLIFEWDARKAWANLKKHRVSLEEAKTVFNDPWLLTYPDELHSETEERYISIGYSIRIISSRKATAAERKTYENPAA